MNFAGLINQIKWFSGSELTLVDVLQIVILAFCLYYLINNLYGTRGWILVKGLIIIGVVYLIIYLTDMTVLQQILQSLFSTMIIAIIIMLQPELQKIVELIGNRKLTDIKAALSKKTYDTASWYSKKTIHEIVTACKAMSKTKTGALIVLERGIPLAEYKNSGIDIGSSVSSQLLLNIFEKNTPLHDGAVIISDNRIASATCYLPISTNYGIDKKLGTRHRAALGISETTDCVVVVVSEETGAISICADSNITHDIDKDKIFEYLEEKMGKYDEKAVKRKSKTPIWIKVLAPILSVVMWAVVVTVNDPAITKVINDVPVTPINTQVLDDIGQAYFINSGSTISVKVEGKRSLLKEMTKEDLVATADFSNMSMVYAVPIDVIPVDVYKNVTIVSTNNAIMKLELEEMTQTNIPVKVNIIGDTNNNYFVKLRKLDTESVTIVCPQSIAKTLDNAVLTIDANGKTNDFISSATPVIYDKNGNVISDNKYTISTPSIRVEMSVIEVKNIPINVQLAQQTIGADIYYVLNEYNAEFDTISVAVDNNIIAEMKSLEIVITPDSNMKDTNSVLISLTQYLPDGVYLAKGQNDQMSINVDLTKYQKKVISISDEDIKIVGHDDSKFNLEITTIPSEIVLYYDSSVVSTETVTLNTLNPVLKITANTAGDYATVITMTDIDGVVIVEDLAVAYTIVPIETKE